MHWEDPHGASYLIFAFLLSLLFATGLTAAAKTKDANGVRDYTKKAAAALDEVILIGKANKL